MSNEMISVPRELLEQALQADASMGASTTQLVEGWAAMKELRELLSMPSLEDYRADLIAYLRGEVQRFESIFTPTDLMLLRGGEKMLELCAPEGKFVGISWNDMREVLAAMIAVSPIGSGKLEQEAVTQPAEQHQGEPVAFQWRCKTVNEGSQWRHWVDCTEEDYNKTIENPGPNPRGIIREARKLYTRPAEQPAPVAVVIPVEDTRLNPPQQ